MFMFEQKGYKNMKPCEETAPYAGYTNPEFIAAQAEQRKCLDVATGFDWSKIDVSGIERGIGLLISPWPNSYNRAMFEPSECSNGNQLVEDFNQELC